jgi:hypothetical protein
MTALVEKVGPLNLADSSVNLIRAMISFRYFHKYDNKL